MKKEACFSVNINRIPPEGKEFLFPMSPLWIADNLSECEIQPSSSEGSVQFTLSPLGENFYVKGTISLTIQMTCVRCLSQVPLSLKVPLAVVMVRKYSSRLLPVGQKEDSGVRRISGEEIILDEEIRESILLELPMNPTCPGGCSLEDLYRK